LLILLIAAVCGLSVWGIVWYRGRPITTSALLQRIPGSNPMVLYVDFSTLRRAGLLDRFSGTKAAEDPDYQLFVRKTNFDYRQDLDSAVLAFTPTGRYLLVRGRFDWKTLRTYAQSEGGHCVVSLCTMQGSTPDRNISFFPMQPNLMGMAVSQEEDAARHLMNHDGPAQSGLPNAPVWLLVPGTLLQSGQTLPEGTRMFARALERADRLTLAIVPESNRLSARLEAHCRTEQDAVALASELSSATGTLRKMIELEHHTPNPGDLSGVLSSGTFDNKGTTVSGYWPIEPSFVDYVLGGGLG
jgi:hypothetical protein